MMAKSEVEYFISLPVVIVERLLVSRVVLNLGL